MFAIDSPTTQSTHALGRALGGVVLPGTVVALVGDLGAGKTVFAKGIGEGLMVPTRIQSPSFILVALHDGGRIVLWHADFYRLGDVSELQQLGLDEALDGSGVVVVEWADRFEDFLPPDSLWVHLEGYDRGRRIRARATGPRHRVILDNWRAAWERSHE